MTCGEHRGGVWGSFREHDRTREGCNLNAEPHGHMSDEACAPERRASMASHALSSRSGPPAPTPTREPATLCVNMLSFSNRIDCGDGRDAVVRYIPGVCSLKFVWVGCAA